MKGELSLCITMTFRPHSFSHCLTVFGQQMHPHRGVAAPSLHPQSQHGTPHNSPNKRERRVGPSCASCGPWTFEVCWENIPVHVNYIKKRAAVEFNVNTPLKRFKNKRFVCCVLFIISQCLSLFNILTFSAAGAASFPINVQSSYEVKHKTLSYLTAY